MKKNNKKGFTIVELVIVIAVIGILAAVLIPTFGGIIDKANNSALLQNVRNEYSEYVVAAGKDVKDIVFIKYEGKFYKVENGVVANTNGTPTETNPTADTDVCFCAKCNKIAAKNAFEHTCQ